jgi:ABC-type transport system involved in multi-copper enzyme maturation permease subunit
MVTIFRRLRQRISFTALFLAFLSIASVLITPVFLSTNSSATKTAADTQKINASSEMSAATTSLKSGQGPSGLGLVNCAPTGSGSAYCETSTTHPASSSSVIPSWTNITSSTGPSPFNCASMTYDAADGYVILFSIGGSPGRFIGATWKFLGGSWTNISTSSASPRVVASMAYDGADGYLVLFGGYNSFGGFFADTWKFIGGSWANITSGSPSSRTGAAMAYDVADGCVVLFGGQIFVGSSIVVVGDTWKFSSSGAPTFDYSLSISGPVSITAGGTGTVMITAKLTAGVAQSVTLSCVTPLPSGIHCASFNPPSVTPSSTGATSTLTISVASSVVPGSQHVQVSGSPLGSTTTATSISVTISNPGEWTNITPGSSPSPRDGAMAYDAADGYVVLFGGESGSFGLLADTWKFLGGSWTNITSGESPSARVEASMAYDAADGYVILFGGGSSSGLLHDTWKFLGGSWTNITSSSSPSSRYEASMVYDVADGYVILFGGIGSPGHLADTWKFLAGSWTNITPNLSPRARISASIAYDTADGCVLMFGGGTQGQSGSLSAVYGDTWKFLGGSWSNITSGSGPSPRAFAAIVFDGSDGYVILFGGVSTSTGFSPVGDTWRFLGGSWADITPSNSPAPRADASISYDTADRYVVLFGGVGSSYVRLGDTWKFSSTSIVAGFDYTLSFSPSSASIVAGSSVSATLTATLTSGTAQQVTLMGSVSPFPTACQGTTGNPYPCGTYGLSPSIITPTIVGATSVLGIESTSTLPPGTYTLTFNGSPGGASSSSAVFILVVKSSTSLSVTCSPSSIPVGTFATCTARVTGHSPTGTVTFTSQDVCQLSIYCRVLCNPICPATGSFVGNACFVQPTVLNDAYECSVPYTDTASITATITASYIGDTYNQPTVATFSLSVSKPAGVIAVGANSLTLNNGGVTANQGAITGVSVTITGSTAANGTPVGLTTQTLSSPSGGVPTASLGSPSYYDVLVTGVSSGNAQVCISFTLATSSLTMQYWTGTAWTTASSITVSGSTICGLIPVSALIGTNIALGSTTPNPNPMLFYEIVAGLVAVIVIVAAALVLRRRGRGRLRAVPGTAPPSQPPGTVDASPVSTSPEQTPQLRFERKSEAAGTPRDSDALRARGKPAGLGRRLVSIIRYESTWDRRKFWPYVSTALLLVFSLAIVLVLSRILSLIPGSTFSDLSTSAWMYSIVVLVGVPTGFLAFLVGEVSSSGTIGHERDKGTLANLLAQPLRRSEIFLGKYLAKLIWFLALSTAIVTLMIVSSRILLGPQVHLEYAPIVVLDLTLTFLFFAALAQFLSCFFRRSRTVFFIIAVMWLVVTIPTSLFIVWTLITSATGSGSPALVEWLLTLNPLSFSNMTLAGTVLYLAPLSTLSASAMSVGTPNFVSPIGIGTIGFAEKSTISLLFGTLGFLALGWLAFRRIEITG